jgi:hypothetical protein
MTKPDANKQHKPGDVLGYLDAQAYGDGPFCWNCELSFESMEDAPPDLPVHFCTPLCERDWATRQPLRNLLDKRRMKRERGE